MPSRALNDQRWPQRPAIRARYDAAACAAGYADLEDLLADTGLTGPEAGRELGVSEQMVGIMRRQRGIWRQPAPARAHLTVPEASEAAVALLRLRRFMRKARETAGLTQYEAAAAVGNSPSKIIRIESGQIRPSIPDVRALLDVYGAHGEREMAERLAKAAKGRRWTSAYHDVLSMGDRACAELEASADTIDTVALLLMPALLQTEDYAQAVNRALRPPAAPELAGRRVEATVRRQQLLLDDPPELRFWLDESVLRRGMDAAVRGQQLDHLLKLATHPQITIRVIPLIEVYTDASFTMLRLDDPAETLLYVETPNGAGLVRQEDPAEVEHHHRIVDWCDQHALPADSLGEAVDNTRRGTHLVLPEHATAHPADATA